MAMKATFLVAFMLFIITAEHVLAHAMEMAAPAPEYKHHDHDHEHHHKGEPPAIPRHMLPRHHCLSKCVTYCKKDFQRKRPCMKPCTACCDRYKCVPEPKKKCGGWEDDLMMHGGKRIKCPKY